MRDAYAIFHRYPMRKSDPRSKDGWMYAYARIVRKRARRRPTPDAIWTTAHMYHSMGMSPTAAASKFLRSTKWGAKRVLRKTKHRRSR